MPPVTLDPARSILVVVDLQPNFLKTIHEGERVLAHAAFLAGIAKLVQVPVLATEQYPERMGPTEAAVRPWVDRAFPKMSFSATGCDEWMRALEETGRRQVVLVGVETHICVSLTANALLAAGYEVVVCPDAVSSRTMDRHRLGMERIRDAGAAPAHTEAVAYEWLGTAEHPRFRAALSLVKELS